MAKTVVRVVESEAEREAIYRFRYQVYVEELGLTAQADHENRWLRDQYDDQSLSFAVFEGDDVVGSLRLILMDHVRDPAPLINAFEMGPAMAEFGASAVVTSSRFIIAPHKRNSMAIFQLVREAFLTALARGIRTNFGDCSPHLLPFYEQLGYRRYTRGYNDTAFGYKVPILMLIGDLGYFKTVRSPLATVLPEHRIDPPARAWFERTYPDYVKLQSAGLIGEDVFFDLLAERVAHDPLHAVALLRGLTQDEAARFLDKATIMNVRPGDRLIRQGERDNTVYVLLKGLAEVRLGDDDGPPLAVYGAGDTFGEIAFLTAVPRTANVIAQTEGEALVLSGDFLERFIRAEPEIAAKVLLNLSRELAGRIAWSNQRERGAASA